MTPSSTLNIKQYGMLAALLPIIWVVARRFCSTRQRSLILARHKERVVVIGGSSGIGRAIAKLYAESGAHVCIVGRREPQLYKVLHECNADDGTSRANDKRIFSVTADFADPDDMVHLRNVLLTEWRGVDTVIVAAGASAVKPLLEVAGVGHKVSNLQTTVEGLRRAVVAANAASRSNYIGPLVSAVSLIPLLQSSSSSPSILLISSLAALIPAPTRSLYGSSKAASLILYESLSIEHPHITFSMVIPTSVKGNFRSSAVDMSPSDEPALMSTKGLEVDYVAERCIQAVDYGQKFVFLPYTFGRIGHLLYWVWPSFVEAQARRKYAFTI